jgi:hypothetical protein
VARKVVHGLCAVYYDGVDASTLLHPDLYVLTTCRNTVRGTRMLRATYSRV